jgi:hypothetical protein
MRFRIRVQVAFARITALHTDTIFNCTSRTFGRQANCADRAVADFLRLLFDIHLLKLRLKSLNYILHQLYAPNSNREFLLLLPCFMRIKAYFFRVITSFVEEILSLKWMIERSFTVEALYFFASL